MLNTIILGISITLMYSSPLVFSALGGVITQRAGVDNIGIEGMMSFGSFCGASIGCATGNPWLGFLAGGLGGAVLALAHAFAAINLRGTQTISGVAMNFIGPGLALFLCRLQFDGGAQSSVVPNKMPNILGLFGIESQSLLNVNVTIIIAFFLVVLMWFVLYKTKWGLRILACGEQPAAADTLGVNVYAVRYICCILSGFLAGLGGATMTLAVVSSFSSAVISGQGFIALAAVIFGKWSPHGAAGACLLFGFAQALVVLMGGINIPSQLLAMLPYVLTLVVLVLFVGRSEAPKANGRPYVKGER